MANKQAIVLGLGQFGMSLCRALVTRNVEVIAVDVREERVRVAAAFGAEALAFDATDTEALERLSPGRRDLGVCAIGDEAKEASIICTALLRQMGVPKVIARANDDLHARILGLVGAHVVVNPEREFGERFATRLVYDGILGELPLGEDLVITQLQPPPRFVGRTLAELQLPRRHGITVVAVRRRGHETALLPNPNEPLQADDIMVTVARRDVVGKILEKL